MKDPLQRVETPYEVLGLSENVNKGEIDKAFKNALLSKKYSPSEITSARNVLVDPLERTLLDLFLYQDEFLKLVIPRLKDSSQLINKRKEIAEGWRNLHRRTFPNLPCAHSLAVLWYWWALSHRENNDHVSDLIEFDRSEVWSLMIAFWVYIINSDEFWNRWVELKSYININNVEAIKEKLIKHFEMLFERLIEKTDKEKDKKFYKEYKRKFFIENEIAKRFKDIGFEITLKKDIDENKKIEITFGKLMLNELDIFENVQRNIEKIMESPLHNKKFEELKCLLSSVAEVKFLYDEKKYEEAIFEGEAKLKNPSLSDNERREILRYLVRSYLKMGEQLFNLEKFEEAILYWEMGGDYLGNLNKNDKVYQEFYNTIASISKNRINSLIEQDPDFAIQLLKRIIKLVSDKELIRVLSGLYVAKGVSKINRAVEQFDKQFKTGRVDLDKFIEDVKDGIRDLEEALRIDPDNTHAKEQLEKVKELLRVFSNLYVAKGVSKINRAFEQLKLGKLDLSGVLSEVKDGIRDLEEALRIDPDNTHAKEQLEKARELLRDLEELLKRPQRKPPEPVLPEVPIFIAIPMFIIMEGWKYLSLIGIGILFLFTWDKIFTWDKFSQKLWGKITWGDFVETIAVIWIIYWLFKFIIKLKENL